MTDADGEQQETQHWIETAYDCKYISEKQKERFMQQVKMGLQQNHTEQTQSITERIQMVQNSSLSDSQKKKVIDMLNKRNQNPAENSIDNMFGDADNKQ